ncbi:hypothetical protein CPB86DRAFT_781404 [Serendipita vermifera]|nr:hypothetical protein CPB86DRAFT_781404 [Serendipita vermifera]
MRGVSTLPNELLSFIIRQATLDEDALSTTFSQSDPFQLATYRFSEFSSPSIEAFRAKAAISRVCKHWNEICAPFLCEYIYCIGSRSQLDGLARCLMRCGPDGKPCQIGKERGKWTKRVDISFEDFDRDWCTQYDTDSGCEVYGWDHILSITSNITIFDLFQSPSSAPNDWSTQLFFALRSCAHLQRVDWHGSNSDISELQQLSSLCPQLAHIAFTITASTDPDVSTDAINISLPNLLNLILNWDQTDHMSEAFPPFREWDCPRLKHFAYFLRGPNPLRMVRSLCNGFGGHLKSLELPVLGRNSLIRLGGDFLDPFPVLETLIIDVFKVSLPLPNTISTAFGNKPEKHKYLRTLGLRLRLGAALIDIERLTSCCEYFSRINFPALELVRVVHPYDITEYTNNMTFPLIPFWNTQILREWGVPVVDFEGNLIHPLEIPISDPLYTVEETDEDYTA